MFYTVVTLSRHWNLSLEKRCRFKSELLGRKESLAWQSVDMQQQQYRRSSRCAVLTPVQNALQADNAATTAAAAAAAVTTAAAAADQCHEGCEPAGHDDGHH
jgi:hypothetical protein